MEFNIEPHNHIKSFLSYTFTHTYKSLTDPCYEEDSYQALSTRDLTLDSF